MDTHEPQIDEMLRARLASRLGDLNGELMGAVGRVLRAADAEQFYDAERHVAALMRQRADQLVATVLEHRCTAAEFVEPARARAHTMANALGWNLISNGRRQTRVQLLGGMQVTLETLRMRPVMPVRPGRKRGVGRRGEAGTGFYPVLAELGITGLATPALMAEVSREVAEAASVDVARASLLERGLDIPHKTALRLTYQFAERALATRQFELASLEVSPERRDGELVGKRVVVSVDGGRIRIRKTPKTGRRNTTTRHRRYQAPWKEPKVITIYVVDKDGQRDKQYDVVLDATMGDADAAMALLVGHLRLRGAQFAEHLTLVGDGAAWIWARGSSLRAAVGIAPARFTEVVDWYHACEHLSEVSSIPKSWAESERKKWVAAAKRNLYAGRVEAVLESIEALRVGRRGKAIGRCLGYFSDHRDRMRYANYRSAGIPIGSGAVESAVRRVVNLRMKGNSMYWLAEHAEAMLHLRAFLKAGRWDQLVRSTIRRPVWTPPEAVLQAA